MSIGSKEDSSCMLSRKNDISSDKSPAAGTCMNQESELYVFFA